MLLRSLVEGGRPCVEPPACAHAARTIRSSGTVYGHADGTQSLRIDNEGLRKGCTEGLQEVKYARPLKLGGSLIHLIGREVGAA